MHKAFSQQAATGAPQLPVVDRISIPHSQFLDWPPRLVGGLLVLAALLKAQRLLQGPAVAATGVFDAPWFQTCLIVFEWALGTALLVRVQPKICKFAGVGTFSAFLCVSVVRAAGGERSCACMGNVPVSPWLTSAVDLAAFACLVRWPSAPRPRRPWAELLWCLPLAAVGLAVIPAGVRWQFSESTSRVLQSTTPELRVDHLASGKQTTVSLVLRNTLGQDVLVDHVSSSCPCLSALNLPWRFQPAEEKEVFLRLDLSRETDFAGSLGITYNARLSSGVTAFQGVVRATVR
jgi:hypothetical protein